MDVNHDLANNQVASNISMSNLMYGNFKLLSNLSNLLTAPAHVMAFPEKYKDKDVEKISNIFHDML